MGIDVNQADCGSQALIRLDTNLASRSDSTIRDIDTTALQAMEDAVHRIQTCTGQSSAFSIEIATWRITTAATKATGTVLTDADEVLSFEAMLRAYNEKTKRFQANNHPAGGGHFKPLFKAFSTDVREPCQRCLKNLSKTFLHNNRG